MTPKKLFTLLAFLVAIIGHGQYFTLTPEGFTGPDQSYIKAEISGSQEELYKKSVTYFTGLYKNADKVMSNAEPDVIVLNGYAGNSVRRAGEHRFDMDYTLAIRFKDGKVRIDAPNFDLYNFTQRLKLVSNSKGFIANEYGIYNKKHKLKSPLAKEDLENYFNDFVSNYLNSFKNQEDW